MPKYKIGQLVNVMCLDMFVFVVKAIHITEGKIEYDLDCGSMIGTWEEKYISNYSTNN